MDAQQNNTVPVAPNAQILSDRSERTNQQWVDALSGRTTRAAQRRAHEDLARHLYRAGITYLTTRRGTVPQLGALSQEEVAHLAQDIVQNVLARLARDEFALLEQFSDQGRFLSWMTQHLVRTVAGELKFWAETGERLQMYLDQLPASQRTAFWERVVARRPADEVGALLGVSASEVHALVRGAKEQLRGHLARADATREMLV